MLTKRLQAPGTRSQRSSNIFLGRGDRAWIWKKQEKKIADFSTNVQNNPIASRTLVADILQAYPGHYEQVPRSRPKSIRPEVSILILRLPPRYKCRCSVYSAIVTSHLFSTTTSIWRALDYFNRASLRYQLTVMEKYPPSLPPSSRGRVDKCLTTAACKKWVHLLPLRCAPPIFTTLGYKDISHGVSYAAASPTARYGSWQKHLLQVRPLTYVSPVSFLAFSSCTSLYHIVSPSPFDNCNRFYATRRDAETTTAKDAFYFV